MSTARPYVDMSPFATNTGDIANVTLYFPDWTGADATLAGCSVAKLRHLIRGAQLYNLGLLVGEWGHIELSPADVAMACELELMRRAGET